MFGGPLTIGSQAYVRNPGERTQQIRRIKVQTNIAARDRTFDQLCNCMFHLCRGRRVQIGRAADNRIEHLIHPVFGGDVVREQQQPFTERRQRRMRLREAVGGCDKLLGLVAVDRGDQRLAGGEMAVESPGPDSGGASDLIEAVCWPPGAISEAMRFTSTKWPR